MIVTVNSTLLAIVASTHGFLSLRDTIAAEDTNMVLRIVVGERVRSFSVGIGDMALVVEESGTLAGEGERSCVVGIGDMALVVKESGALDVVVVQ